MSKEGGLNWLNVGPLICPNILILIALILAQRNYLLIQCSKNTFFV